MALPQDKQLESIHSCEICGLSGLSDDEIRVHTRRYHVDGQGQCPFCGLSDVPEAELVVHVNTAHLDYLTPENENMSFIDDRSPSVEGDSDSMDGRGANGGSATNGFSNPMMDHSLRNGNGHHQHNNLNDIETQNKKDVVTITTTGATPKR